MKNKKLGRKTERVRAKFGLPSLKSGIGWFDPYGYQRQMLSRVGRNASVLVGDMRANCGMMDTYIEFRRLVNGFELIWLN